jgi:hypothetical protein
MDYPTYCYVASFDTGYRAEVQNAEGEAHRKDFTNKGEAMAWATTMGIMLGVNIRGGARFIKS